jgi:hypothetical protein
MVAYGNEEGLFTTSSNCPTEDTTATSVAHCIESRICSFFEAISGLEATPRLLTGKIRLEAGPNSFFVDKNHKLKHGILVRLNQNIR